MIFRQTNCRFRGLIERTVFDVGFPGQSMSFTNGDATAGVRIEFVFIDGPVRRKQGAATIVKFYVLFPVLRGVFGSPEG
jgi:hypothetical protein